MSVGVVAAFLCLLAPVAPASGGTNGLMVGILPEFPTRVGVGASDVRASINLVNSSVGEEAKGPVTVTEVLLVPSCGNFTPLCEGVADPGVFQLSAKGTGAPGTNCANRSFDITPVDPATGRVRFSYTDRSPIVLAATDMTTELDTCRVHFTLSALKQPSIDSYPSVGEPQTNQVGFMSVRHGNGSTATDQGEDVTTLVAGATTTTTVAPTTSTSTTTTTTTAAPSTTTTAPPTTVATTTTTRVLDARNVRWVERVFRDLLGRAPTKAESDHWAGTLDGGMHTRGNAAKAITASDEFRRLTIGRYSIAYLGRPATSSELTAQVDMVAAGATLQAVEAGVLGSDEFYARHGSDPQRYVEALYQNVLNLAPDSVLAASKADEIRHGVSRASIALWFTTHPTCHDRLATAATYWLLRRAPDPTEVTAWSDSLDAGVRQEHFFAYLTSSHEYWIKS